MNIQLKGQKEHNSTTDLRGDIKMRQLITLTGIVDIRKNDTEAGTVAQWQSSCVTC